MKRPSCVRNASLRVPSRAVWTFACASGVSGWSASRAARSVPGTFVIASSDAMPWPCSQRKICSARYLGAPAAVTQAVSSSGSNARDPRVGLGSGRTATVTARKDTYDPLAGALPGAARMGRAVPFSVHAEARRGRHLHGRRVIAGGGARRPGRSPAAAPAGWRPSSRRPRSCSRCRRPSGRR